MRMVQPESCHFGIRQSKDQKEMMQWRQIEQAKEKIYRKKGQKTQEKSKKEPAKKSGVWNIQKSRSMRHLLPEAEKQDIASFHPEI